jgi:hypothetical protein
MVDLGADRGMSTTRRTLVRGAAWSVPVVAVAATAPAFAASPCDAITLPSFALSGGTTGTASNGTRTWTKSLTTGTSTLTLSATSSYTGSMAMASNQSPYAHFGTAADAGNTNTVGLQMFQERGTANVTTPSDHAGTYTYTFTRPVTNLTFTLSDIDRYQYQEGRWNPVDYYQYDDRVAVTSSQGAFTVQSRGSNVVTSSLGTVANPFRPIESGNIDLDEGMGNAVVRFAGPMTTFAITYWNAFANANADSRIQVTLLSNMSFTYAPCG